MKTTKIVKVDYRGPKITVFVSVLAAGDVWTTTDTRSFRDVASAQKYADKLQKKIDAEK